MVGGPSQVVTRKTVNCYWRNLHPQVHKFLQIDCCNRWWPTLPLLNVSFYGSTQKNEFDADLQRLKPRQNKSRSLKFIFMPYFQRMRPDCRIESLYTTETQKRLSLTKKMGSMDIDRVFEVMGCFHPYCPCQEARPAPTENDIQRGTRKKKMDEMRKQYVEEEGYTVVKMWECEWWKLYETDLSINYYLRESTAFKPQLCHDQSLNTTKSGIILCYLQCDIRVPEHLRGKFASFSPVFKKTNV